MSFDQKNTINIELEITLQCNISCPQCSRHCNLFSYGNSDMTMEQIRKFIEEVRSSKVPVNKVMIIGGEPTVHPNFQEIVISLYESLVKTQKIKILKITTNGIREIPESIRHLPIDIKKSPLSEKKHRCQFIAPRDTGQEMQSCDVPYVCGMALNCFGYSPCGAGAAIARLFGMRDFIRYTLPSRLADFGDLSELCSLCQVSAKEPKMFGVDDCTPSRSFLMAMEQYHICKPEFKRY
jgi:organic radical activating enzyme